MESTERSSGTAAGYHRIVVGVNGSEASVDAHRRAVGIAEKFGSRIDAFCMWSHPVAYTLLPVGWYPERDAQQVVNQVANTVLGPRGRTGSPQEFGKALQHSC